ncbi:hypothetical protein KC901_03520 [Patescibacteria group bacterium]|nr:hypothetical protein [Patescibacteria group bacterium]
MKQLHTDSQTNPQQALRLQKGYLHQYTGSEAPPFPISFSGEDVLDAAKKIIKKGIYGTFRTQAHLLAFLKNGFKTIGNYGVYVE